MRINSSDPKAEDIRISVVWLATYGKDAYSRPREMIPLMVLQIIYLWSKRGATTLYHVELVAREYMQIYPKSSEVINIFLDRVRRDHHVP